MAAEPLLTASEAAAGWAGFADLPADRQAALLASGASVVASVLGRPAGLDTYEEIHRPERSRAIFLRRRPVRTLLRVACDLASVLEVTNPSAATSRAVVTLDASGLTLTATTSGTATSVVVPFSGSATVEALAAAINAAGSGWSGRVLPPWGQWATADLLVEPGVYGAKDEALFLRAYTRDLSDYLPHPEAGLLELREPFSTAFRHPDRPFASDPRRGGVFVRYSAGWPTAEVPAAIKQACLVAAKAVGEKAKSTGTYRSESLGARSWTLSDLPAGIHGLVADLLAPWAPMEFA